MSYARAADAAEAYAEAIRAASSDRQVLRSVDAFAAMARSLDSALSFEAALEMINDVAEPGAPGRLGGASMGDVAAVAEEVTALARTLDAKPAVLSALEGMAQIAEEHAPADASRMIAALRELRERQRAEAATRAQQQREKERADRELGADYAQRLADAPQTADALGSIVEEMKKHRPPLPSDCWKEAANLWIGRDDARSGKAAREAIESQLGFIADRDAETEPQAAVA